ncbi:hypothetical protein PENTCL1PPCAC_1095, partial [Pristionchus entomophagus]
EEPIDVIQNIAGDNQMLASIVVSDEMNPTGEAISDHVRDDSSEAEMEKRRRSSRVVSRSQKYIDYIDSKEESDGDEESSKKKSKTDEKERNKRQTSRQEDPLFRSQEVNTSRISTISETDMECPECEYRTNTVSSFLTHLRSKHSTNLRLAGLILLCACSHEGYSERHSYLKTPQCALCETYPATAYGYIRHLQRHHNTTLCANGIFLTCECGFKVTSIKKSNIHNKKCDRRQFTLNKLSKE